MFGTRSLHCIIIQGASQAAHVECVKCFVVVVVSGVEDPRLIAIQRRGEDAGTVCCHFNVATEIAVLPHSLRQSSKGGRRSTNSSVDLSILGRSYSWWWNPDR